MSMKQSRQTLRPSMNRPDSVPHNLHSFGVFLCLMGIIIAYFDKHVKAKSNVQYYLTSP